MSTFLRMHDLLRRGVLQSASILLPVSSRGEKPTPADPRPRYLTVVGLVAALLVPAMGVQPAAASTSSISGTAYQDLDRDGVRSSGEAPFADHLIYLRDADGILVASRRTDDSGDYRFSGLAPGTYTVTYQRAQWREIWSDWVPTTTGSIEPAHTVTLSGGEVTADFGWRRVVTSDTPLTQVTGPDGLRVQSFNDVIHAQEIYDHLQQEFLIGDEASDTTVRFASSANMTTSTRFFDADGSISRVRSTVNVTYTSWLERGDLWLAHEYGHAWTSYHNFYVQQDTDGSWATYLRARGIDPHDERVGSSYAWMPAEIAAEDYRQLFASDNAREGRQINHELPEPQEVDGFEAWLRDEFTRASEDADGEAAQPDESGADDPASDDPTHESEPPQDGDPTGTGPIDVEVEVDKVRGVNHADVTWAGADGPVEIRRDGARIGTATGHSFRDDTGSRGSPTMTYRVCELESPRCSDEVVVRF